MKLAEWRALRGKTQLWVADECDCTVSAIARYEGGIRIPEPVTMKKIYLLTDGAVTPNDFYDLPDLIPQRKAA